jgi:hypothetical protein
MLLNLTLHQDYLQDITLQKAKQNSVAFCPKMIPNGSLILVTPYSLRQPGLFNHHTIISTIIRIESVRSGVFHYIQSAKIPQEAGHLAEKTQSLQIQSADEDSVCIVPETASDEGFGFGLAVKVYADAIRSRWEAAAHIVCSGVCCIERFVSYLSEAVRIPRAVVGIEIPFSMSAIF